MSNGKKSRRGRPPGKTLPPVHERSVTDRFRALRLRAGLSLEALAKSAGYAGASSIQRYEDPSPRGFHKKYMPRDVVDRFAPHLVGRGDPPISEHEVYVRLAGGAPVGRPMGLAEEPAVSSFEHDVRAPAQPVSAPAIAQLPRNVRVLGTAAGGDDGSFELSGQEIDFVRRPPGVAAARDVYAVYVVNDSMSPRFEAGDLVYVHPGRPPAVGDYVVVQLRESEHGAHRALIKRLVKRTAGILHLEQFNPPKRKEIPMRQVEAVHRILTPNDLFGV